MLVLESTQPKSYSIRTADEAILQRDAPVADSGRSM